MAVAGDVDTFVSVVKKRCREIPQFQDISLDGLQWELAGSGNLNDVIRIYHPDNRDVSVIVKHAPPYVKCLGKDYPLGAGRGDIEYRAIRAFNACRPGSCPTTYFYDEESKLICMEDLRRYADFRKELVAGCSHLMAARKVAKDIAVVHRETHRMKISKDAMDDVMQKFPNTSELVGITTQYVFTGPFSPGEATNRYSEEVGARLTSVHGDPLVLEAAARMRALFLEKRECLLHGDLHTGSIMVSKDLKDGKMMDLEFAFVGPGSFDVGTLLANYLFAHYNHMLRGNRELAYQMVDLCKDTVNTYLDTLREGVDIDQQYESSFMSEVAGFAGCEIIRRIIGAAHVEDLEGCPGAEVDCLGAGVRLLHAVDRINTVDRFLVISLMLV